MTLTANQRAFLRFHLGNVTQWRWHFLGCQIRDDLEDMVEAGLLAKGVGCADYAITPEGRACLEKESVK